MNRVTIVNLAGRAWHVESSGADALERWLDDARTRLAADPDRDELLLDFERAIADRCRTVAPDDRDVVSGAQVDEILTALGPVQPAVEPGDPDAVATDQLPRADVPLRDRRLYRLTGEDEAKLGGVCAGLAAYLHVDVTVVRVLFVVLAFITSGAMLLVYVAMWLIVPEAITAEQRAQARGAGLTAEEMMSRARDTASPALAQLGSLIGRAALLVGRVVRWTLVTVILLLLALWATAMAWLVIDGGELVDLFDEGTSTWLVGMWLTCVAWVPVSVLLAIERLLAWSTRRRGAPRSAGATAAFGAVLAASFVLASIGANAIPAASSSQLRDLADGHGTIELYDVEICVDADDHAPRAGGADDECDGADLTIR